MNSKYADRAIPLVSVDATGKYVLTKEAEDFLKSVPGPIGVVSVAGLYRTGKSYLLNQMILNRSNGFGVGPSINPCTKGLWCWGSPIKGVTPEGDKLNIIVIDTEGIGALDEDQTHDTRIFTLAILASSCFIYNSVGSIDETAVQNLSLVVNLTKHIQLSTDKITTEEDADKMANYFPTFFWVVRDFSLQIVDPEGNKLTSKEYLEKALAPQKGFSEDIEEKNSIRRHLTSFFKDRDCFTLVRPLIDEDKLQDLDKMNFDQLRPEFGTQVIEFRKRVLTKMKPKTLNGQKLSGSLYLSMLSSYVGAINEGAVPNIENAWNYMCQEQCQKVLEESYAVFDNEIREIRTPCSQEEITRNIEKLEETCFEFFKKNSIGDEPEKYYMELQRRVKERSKNLRIENADKGKAAFKQYIQPFTKVIQEKVSKEKYNSLDEFIEDLKKLEEKAEKDGPNYVDSKLNCSLCVNRLLIQGAGFIFKKMRNEKEQMKKTLEERVKLNENEVENIKRDRETEQHNMRERISELDNQKVKMTFEIEKMKLELESNTRARTQEGEELTRNLAAKKSEIERIRNECEAKVAEALEKMEKMTKDIFLKESEWDKEKSMFEQKIKLQCDKIEGYEKKRQMLDAQLATETVTLTEKHQKELLQYEQKVQDLNKKLNSMKESHDDVSYKLSTLSEEYKTMSEKFELNERKFKEENFSKSQEIERLKREQEIETNRIRNELEQTRDDQERGNRELEEKSKKNELKIRELTEELKNSKNEVEKQRKILTQEIEFSEKKREELKQQLQENKMTYENRIAAIEADKGMLQDEMYNQKISEMRDMHEDELNNLKTDYEDNIQELKTQLDNLKKEKNDFEIKCSVASQELVNIRLEKETSDDSFRKQIEDLETRMKNLERDQENKLLEKAKEYEERIMELVNELENEKSNNEAEKSEESKKIENQLIQLKNFYEIEREKLESKVAEEKDSIKRKLDKRLKDESERFRQEIEELEEEKERIELEYGGEIEVLRTSLNQITQEKEGLARDKVNLEEKFRNLDANYTKMEYELNQKLNKAYETHKTEKDNLSRKLDELQLEKNNVEKEKLTMNHTIDQLRTLSHKQEEELVELRRDHLELKNRFETIRTTMEEKLKEAETNAMNTKSRNETTIALLEQNISFLEEKKAEMEREGKNYKERTEAALKASQEKYDKTINELKMSAIADRKTLQEKIEALKKRNQEAETQFQRELTELGKSKVIVDEKLENTEKKLSILQSTYETEARSLNEEIKASKERFSVERTGLKATIDGLEEKIQKVENESSRMRNEFEIENALLKNQLRNTEESKESYLNEKMDLIKKLEIQLEEYRKKSENEKSNQEATHQTILSRIETKYREENKRLSQELTRVTSQIDHLRKEYEKHKHEMNEKLAMERQARQQADTKISRMDEENREKERRHQELVEQLRIDRDLRVRELERAINEDRRVMKEKLFEEEKKRKDAEKGREQVRIEQNTREARWSMEKSNLEKRIDEYREDKETLQMQRDRLLRDNEKLKAEKKKNTSFIRGNQTTFINREIPVENKENTQYQ